MMQIAQKNQTKIFDLFEAHETAMHELYSFFATKYSDYEDFWMDIAGEEKLHADWIRALRDGAEAGQLSVSTDKISTSSIENSLHYVKSQIREFSSQENPVDKAFHLAMRLENSIVGKRIYSVIKTDSESTKKMLLNLVKKTRLHSSRIKDMARQRTRLHGLVDCGILSLNDLQSAYDAASKEGDSVESVIMKTFNVPKGAILTCISTFYKVSPWSFDADDPWFPVSLAQRLMGKYEALKSDLFVPVAEDGRRISVAMADPTDLIKKDYIKKYFPNRDIEFLVGISDDINAAIDELFGVKNATAVKFMDQILDEMKSDAIAEPIQKEASEPEIRENDNIVVQLVNNIITDASNQNASDIHIEPSLDGDVQVRYRIDGVMFKAHVFPRKYRNAVSSRIKIMAGLDIAERRKPQSGKIRFRRWGRRDIELRVETYSTAMGAEDTVMRILSSSKPLPLENLHFNKRNLDEFMRIINKPHGLILCVGPTGSGKTTTLHSALKYLNREDTKIITAEDPVEIMQEGLRQVQVNERAGITFSSAMRSFLRADPDVIMIGEMRDMETASTAIEASLTGHLVLSTLHTNSAPETVIRLIDMGIDRYSFADSLLGILAQRLVRSLCPVCKKEVYLDDDEIEILGREYGSVGLFNSLLDMYGRKVFVASEGGCGICRGKGYKGRIAIHELLMATERVKEAINRKATVSSFRDIAKEEGMTCLRQDGIEKFLLGKTTIEEIRAATN